MVIDFGKEVEDSKYSKYTYKPMYLYITVSSNYEARTTFLFFYKLQTIDK